MDSALATALLVEAGHDVTAVYMRNWSRDLPGFKCPWARELADAERVAVTLGIDLEVWDCEAEYKATVVDYLVDAYAHGYTPNPDVMCNQTVKFGTFLERALAAGADYVATGHYGRVARGDDGRVRLLRALDEHKDQTYFLWRVGEAALARTLLPWARYATRPRCAACARSAAWAWRTSRTPTASASWARWASGRSCSTRWDRRAGDVVEWETGRVLGRHDGAFLFTVGQRRGLDLAVARPATSWTRTSRRTWCT